MDVQQLVDSDGWTARADDMETASAQLAERVASLINRIFIWASGLLGGIVLAGVFLILLAKRK